MSTQYLRKIVRARAKIARKGTVAFWYKAPTPEEESDAPWYEEIGQAIEHANVPAVIVPVTQQSDFTVRYAELQAAGSFDILIIIPGDVDFKPEYNDAVRIANRLLHVSWINSIMPDGTPIIHEIGLK